MARGIYPRKTKPFWGRVDVRGPDDCWEWTCGKSKTGYGAIRVGGKQQGAHRVAYELVNGPIPEGMLVLHSCDNRGCVNPAHLRLGNHSDNTQDAVQRDRHARVWGGFTKLTELQVRRIRILDGALSDPHLARVFGVSKSAVAAARTGRSWGQLK